MRARVRENNAKQQRSSPDAGVRFAATDAKLQSLYDLAEKKETENIRVGKDGRKVLVEGDEWSYGLWLETQPMGGVMYAKRDLSIARNNIEFFLDFQKENGLLPCTCIRAENGDSYRMAWKSGPSEPGAGVSRLLLSIRQRQGLSRTLLPGSRSLRWFSLEIPRFGRRWLS